MTPDSGCVQFALSHDVYDQAAVAEAAAAYAPYLRIEVLRTSAEKTEVGVRLPTDGPEGERVLGEFLNHALDLSVRRKLGRG